MNIIEKKVNQDYLTESEIVAVIQKGVAAANLEGKKVLVIVPDTTRTAPMPLLFKSLCDASLSLVEKLDFMVALGTHPPLSDEVMLKHFGLTKEEKETQFKDVDLINHRWDLEDHLTTLGEISVEEVTELSLGLLKEAIPVQLNKRILSYDLILIMGPVFPHEVVGFSGGNKYFFPGIAGPDIVHATHWLGALITNVKVNGTKTTPIRAVMDRAAAMIPVEKKAFTFVSTSKGLKGIFFGSPEDAWSVAADHSATVHIKYTDRKYHTVLGVAPEMYDDLWVAGKVMYKLEPVVADGGKLIIYAPHIDEVSVTHGKLLDQVGYHVRDYFIKQLDKFKDTPKAIMAHSTHVKGAGTFENGEEKARVEVILATNIPKSRCKQINLGYIDFKTINLNDYKNKEDEGILFVDHAGEILHHVKE